MKLQIVIGVTPTFLAPGSTNVPRLFHCQEFKIYTFNFDTLKHHWDLSPLMCHAPKCLAIPIAGLKDTMW